MDRDRLLWIVMGVLAIGAALLIFNDGAGQSFGIGNDQFARLIALGSIGLVIGVSIFRRGLPGGNFFRTAAIWICLILAMMVGYQLLARNGMLPENFQPRVVPVDSGTGVSASLVNGVDGSLHL